jgi:hypothetical protein
VSDLRGWLLVATVGAPPLELGHALHRIELTSHQAYCLSVPDDHQLCVAMPMDRRQCYALEISLPDDYWVWHWFLIHEDAMLEDVPLERRGFI